jgi:hypothetical protein
MIQTPYRRPRELHRQPMSMSTAINCSTRLARSPVGRGHVASIARSWCCVRERRSPCNNRCFSRLSKRVLQIAHSFCISSFCMGRASFAPRRTLPSFLVLAFAADQTSGCFHEKKCLLPPSGSPFDEHAPTSSRNRGSQSASSTSTTSSR